MKPDGRSIAQLIPKIGLREVFIACLKNYQKNLLRDYEEAKNDQNDEYDLENEDDKDNEDDEEDEDDEDEEDDEDDEDSEDDQDDLDDKDGEEDEEILVPAGVVRKEIPQSVKL